ncbi:hypothetical protein SAMD00019534_064520 [Acytostelium subglobosum LB1]|uniref:hypothetical protein n=1 Tax=Acytostelium subglobosum LB1 TaxID=1410327 RepID=UPI000644C304|nr:hypothetical protein SAMD00019534_064520 [Acytostelium subglobosum LB1]GAM23277.1 hypothetical protein SAMD00019534_064520 [Acytostelium subglobosum LB1]|eukprot:XP_012753726.1 hypothetical protein SAMD00019534_064520 [Acytostelium subglobosum LB1]
MEEGTDKTSGNGLTANRRKRLRKKLSYLQKKSQTLGMQSPDQAEQQDKEKDGEDEDEEVVKDEDNEEDNDEPALVEQDVVPQRQSEERQQEDVHPQQPLKKQKKQNNDQQQQQRRPSWPKQIIANSPASVGELSPVVKHLVKSQQAILEMQQRFELERTMQNDHEISKEIGKYFYKRHTLFTKFDEGILLDKESWFSVTPEKIAIHIAERMKCHTVFDPFCGSGGNVIALAGTCTNVIAADLDVNKLLMAQHNASIYKVQDRISFINADFMHFGPSIQGIRHVDAVFLSPPWGGPSYLYQQSVKLSDFKPDGFEIFRHALNITPNIAYFLPKNTDNMDIAKLTLMSKQHGGSDHCEVEENYLNGNFKTITIYFGNLIRMK